MNSLLRGLDVLIQFFFCKLKVFMLIYVSVCIILSFAEFHIYIFSLFISEGECLLRACVSAEEKARCICGDRACAVDVVEIIIIRI
jgi:hypothetical protein